MRNWSGFRPGTDEAIIPISDVMAIVSTPRHAARLDRSYISSVSDYGPLFFANLKEITKNASFWDPTPL